MLVHLGRLMLNNNNLKVRYDLHMGYGGTLSSGWGSYKKLVAAVERTRHMQDSQGRILALAFD